MPEPLRLLLLEDSPADAHLIYHEIRRAGYALECRCVANESEYLAHLDPAPDLILAADVLPQFDALRALRLLRERGLDIPFILVCGSRGEERAAAVMKEGAADYLLKDRLARLGHAVRQALEQRRLRTEKQQAEESLREQICLARLSADIGVALTKTETLREMLHQCTESITRNLAAAFTRVWTLNPAHHVLELQASAGLYTHLDGPHSRVPVGHLVIGLIAQERRPYLSNAVAQDPRIDQEWATREGLVAFAGYPLLLDDRLVGVLAMFARQPLSAATRRALASVANTIALGLERKRMEESLRETNQTLKALIQNAPLAILATDPHGQVTMWNPAATRLFGWSEQEVLGRPIPIVPPDKQEEFRTLFTQSMASQATPGVETQRQRRDGSRVDVHLSSSPLHDAQGAVSGYMAILADITEGKRLAEQLRQAQKMEAVGRLAGGVAHDFNNLLTIITGYSEVALGQLHPGDPLQSSLEEIRKAGERAAALTRQLLAFSRKQVLVPVVLDLNALLEDMEKMLRRLIGEDIDLVVHPGTKLWQVKADPGQVEQVIMNLVVNARDAMPRGGRLTLATDNVFLDDAYVSHHPGARAGEYVALTVSDTGCGMDGATQARIFEPFFTTKGPDKGTGLGLATVYGIVKQSDGYIEVSSELGLGATFKVYLPRARETRPSGKSRFQMKAPRRGAETVLLVEDEDGVRALSRLVLQNHGYSVLEARNGGEALLLCEQYPGRIHLLVTDVVMPSMSGGQLSQRLASVQPEMKVLYMSGYTDDAILHHGVLEPETPFLQKPFTPDALAGKVREVLDQA